MEGKDIMVRWSPSCEQGSFSCSYEELGTTEAKFQKMNFDQKQELIQEYIDSQPEMVWAVVDSITPNN